MITEVSKLRIDSMSVTSVEASTIVQRRIDNFMQKSVGRMIIYEFAQSEDGEVYDPDAIFVKRTINKEELKILALEIIKEKTAGKPEVRRETEVDSNTNKPIKNSYTEHIWYYTPDRDFVFKLAQKVKNDAVMSGWGLLERINRGPLVTSPPFILPRGKR